MACRAGREPRTVTRLEEVQDAIARLGSALVAFSGGVDSSLVAALAARGLGDRALAVTAVSPALATGELDGARDVARAIGIEHRTISTHELAREGYVLNGRFRCYHCKTELYERLAALAGREGFDFVLSGANLDDSGDWRPGLRAADEHGVRHPLLEAGVTKHEVREMARRLGVPSADKPASPCLASRLPYGSPVSRDALARIDRAERGLKALGYRVFRVRHHGELGVVQIAVDELPRAMIAAQEAAIVEAVRAAGYSNAEVDREPFRSGSLNAAIVSGPQPGSSTWSGAQE